MENGKRFQAFETEMTSFPCSGVCITAGCALCMCYRDHAIHRPVPWILTIWNWKEKTKIILFWYL